MVLLIWAVFVLLRPFELLLSTMAFVAATLPVACFGVGLVVGVGLSVWCWR